jgi:hypothetical protein
MVAPINITARDMNGQKTVRARIPGDLPVGEALPQVANRLGLPVDDITTGGEQTYVGFLPRTNQHLGNGERVGEALREGDEVVLHPESIAG